MADEHNNVPENNGGAKPRGFSSKKNIVFIILVAVLTFGIGSAVIVAGVSNIPANRLSRHMHAAERYMAEMNYERAVIEYQRVLEIDPMNVDAILGLADAYIGLGDVEKAIEVLRDSLERTGDERIRTRLDELEKEEEAPVSLETEDFISEKVVISVQNKEGKPLKDVQITVETNNANDGSKWEQKEKWITDEKGEITGYLPDGEYIITYIYGGQKKTENITIKDMDRELSIILSDEDIDGDSSDIPKGSEDTEGMEIASGTCGDNLNWKIDDKGVLTIFGLGDMYDYSYKKADDNFSPWYNLSVNKIVIEEGATSIGNAAFYKVGGEVDIPEGVTRIGEYAFAGSSIQNVILPNSIEIIEMGAFYASRIETVDIPENVHKISKQMFYQCRDLTFVQMNDGIEEIGMEAFSGCSKLTNITIPDRVTTIGTRAFAHSGLVEIKMPRQLQKSGTCIVSFCDNLEKIEYPDSIKVIGNYLIAGFDDEWPKLNSIIIRNPDCLISKVVFFPSNATIYAYMGGAQEIPFEYFSIEEYINVRGNPFVSLDSIEALD